MTNSFSRDRFDATIVGNLMADPFLSEDKGGNKFCSCKVATNPRARKTDPRTGRETHPEERNKRRSIIELRISDTSKAERFAKGFSEGDRVWLEGEIGTKTAEKTFWSSKQQKRVSVKADVDGDGKNMQDIHEKQWIMWVENFIKIVHEQDL